MMIMTIWWSKATRLLEFSRSWMLVSAEQTLDLRTRLFCDRQTDRGIGYSSKWISNMYCRKFLVQKYLRKIISEHILAIIFFQILDLILRNYPKETLIVLFEARNEITSWFSWSFLFSLWYFTTTGKTRSCK